MNTINSIVIALVVCVLISSFFTRRIANIQEDTADDRFQNEGGLTNGRLKRNTYEQPSGGHGGGGGGVGYTGRLTNDRLKRNANGEPSKRGGRRPKRNANME